MGVLIEEGFLKIDIFPSGSFHFLFTSLSLCSSGFKRIFSTLDSFYDASSSSLNGTYVRSTVSFLYLGNGFLNCGLEVAFFCYYYAFWPPSCSSLSLLLYSSNVCIYLIRGIVVIYSVESPDGLNTTAKQSSEGVAANFLKSLPFWWSLSNNRLWKKYNLVDTDHCAVPTLSLSCRSYAIASNTFC